MENIKQYNPKDITKYFKNQPFLYKIESIFTDKFFPANKSSILGNTSNKITEEILKNGFNINDIIWKNSKEINKDCVLLGEKIDIINSLYLDNFLAGKSKDNSFLRAVESLKEHPTLILNLFKQKEISAAGQYEICLYIDGEWQIVIVDDFIPVDKNKNEIIFTKPFNNEIWPVLLEKAWAKVNEGYLSYLSNNELSDIFLAFTGFPLEQISFNKFIKIDETWSKIKNTLDNHEILFTEINNTNNKLPDNGIVFNNNYLVCGYLEFIIEKEDINILKIKNNTNLTWKGTWSENSHRWTDEIKNKLEISKEDFLNYIYMDFDDFRLQFSSLTIVRYLSNNYVYLIQNEINFQNNNPHIFTLNTSSVTENIEEVVYITISKNNWKFNQTLMNKSSNYPIHIVVSEYNEKDNILSHIISKYTSKESDINLNFLIRKDSTYIVWMYFNLENSSEPLPINFIFKAISQRPNLNVNKSDLNDKNFDLIKKLIQNNSLNNQEILECQSDIYINHKSQFYNSGIGYIFINNKSNNQSYKLEFDNSEIENMKLKIENNDKILLENSNKIILALPNDMNKRFFLNVEIKYSPIITETQNQKNELDKDFGFLKCISASKIKSNFLRYQIPDLENTNISYKPDSFITNTQKLKLIQDNYPEIYDYFIKIIKEKKIEIDFNTLKWIVEEEFDNGFYTGQKDNKNLRNGIGCYCWDSGEIYIGLWENNLRSGYGMQFGIDGNILYEGDYLKGKKHGKGKLFLNNGDIYDGTFNEDIFEGVGSYKWKEGNAFWYGPFTKDKFDGTGLIVLKDGKSHLRDFKNGANIK